MKTNKNERRIYKNIKMKGAVVMIKYRPHRGLLTDAMAEMKTFDTIDEMFAFIVQDWSGCFVKYIGGYAAAMGGIDAVVFTGGIGENNPQYRTRVGKNLEFLGTKVDEEKNACRSKEVEFSTPDSKVKLFVIPTNEELVIARDTLEIVNSL